MSESFRGDLGFYSTPAKDLFQEKLDLLYETDQRLRTEKEAKHPKFSLKKSQIETICQRAEELDALSKRKAKSLKSFLSKKEEKARIEKWKSSGERAVWCVVSFGFWLFGYYAGHKAGKEDDL